MSARFSTLSGLAYFWGPRASSDGDNFVFGPREWGMHLIGFLQTVCFFCYYGSFGVFSRNKCEKNPQLFSVTREQTALDNHVYLLASYRTCQFNSHFTYPQVFNRSPHPKQTAQPLNPSHPDGFRGADPATQSRSLAVSCPERHAPDRPAQANPPNKSAYPTPGSEPGAPGPASGSCSQHAARTA